MDHFFKKLHSVFVSGHADSGLSGPKLPLCSFKDHGGSHAPARAQGRQSYSGKF